MTSLTVLLFYFIFFIFYHLIFYFILFYNLFAGLKNENQNEIEVDTNETKNETNKGSRPAVTQSLFYLRQSCSAGDHPHPSYKNKNKNEDTIGTNQKEFSGKINEVNLIDFDDSYNNRDGCNTTTNNNGSNQSTKDNKTTLFINVSMLVPPVTEEVRIENCCNLSFIIMFYTLLPPTVSLEFN